MFEPNGDFCRLKSPSASKAQHGSWALAGDSNIALEIPGSTDWPEHIPNEANPLLRVHRLPNGNLVAGMHCSHCAGNFAGAQYRRIKGKVQGCERRGTKPAP
ncbi:hypothetical protein GCM10027188_29470 [Lysobacter humi (ex Lee et al. 2017)]